MEPRSRRKSALAAAAAISLTAQDEAGEETGSSNALKRQRLFWPSAAGAAAFPAPAPFSLPASPRDTRDPFFFLPDSHNHPSLLHTNSGSLLRDPAASASRPLGPSNSVTAASPLFHVPHPVSAPSLMYSPNVSPSFFQSTLPQHPSMSLAHPQHRPQPTSQHQAHLHPHQQQRRLPQHLNLNQSFPDFDFQLPLSRVFSSQSLPLPAQLPVNPPPTAIARTPSTLVGKILMVINQLDRLLRSDHPEKGLLIALRERLRNLYQVALHQSAGTHLGITEDHLHRELFEHSHLLLSVNSHPLVNPSSSSQYRPTSVRAELQRITQASPAPMQRVDTWLTTHMPIVDEQERQRQRRLRQMADAELESLTSCSTASTRLSHGQDFNLLRFNSPAVLQECSSLSASPPVVLEPCQRDFCWTQTSTPDPSRVAELQI